MKDNIINYPFPDTTAYFPEHKIIHQFLEEQAKNFPDRVAVKFEGKSYSYKYINSKANLLANYLICNREVKNGEIIGICTNRSVEMIIGIYGIIKAGAVYMPISNDIPKKRLEYLIYDSSIRLIVVFNGNKFDTGKADMIDVEGVLKNYELKDNPYNKCESSDPIYVIYTSGTTGKPKGVVIEHRSVVNRLNWMQKLYPLTDHDVILQKTPVVFDVSVWELFWWVLAGAKMCLLEPGMEKFPQAIVEAIDKNQVTVIHFVPSMLIRFLKYVDSSGEINRLATLRYVFTSGEALNSICVELYNEIIYKKVGAELINLYGPTEATVDVTYYNCPKEGVIKKVPIGKPIDNTKIYIIKDGNIQPPGKEGEICISGIGVARGYLNNPELTVDKFITHPLIEGERLYKTGDLGFFLADGNVEFCGRIDSQVKVRGLRIELEEIESTIMELELIKQCVVINIEKNDDVSLVAYIVANDTIELDLVKKHMRENLPQYMIPNQIKILNELPLLPTGKVDRNKLRNK